ncbi:MAG: thiamine pyrophosphate-binding protein [Bacteroidetes bacterium]|nr:thiamine pyrophosphate-binding protein [Bacteroidota bacterium]
MNGGNLIAKVLSAQKVKFVFTLCGGHISPILTGVKDAGIRVIDVRHEANAVFAADAVSRLTGVPGVAVVTAGPGVTNTVTAVKNASMAQSPLVLMGGAAATVLKGRGSLQDIDQMALMKPHVKWAATVKKVRQIIPLLENAFKIAKNGVPGPVFVELPVDLLYDESVVREWYGAKSNETPAKSFSEKMMKWYLKRHVNKVFKNKENIKFSTKVNSANYPKHTPSDINKVVKQLKRASRPVMLIGNQALLNTNEVNTLAEAVTRLGIPVYLSGIARGLLGKKHPLQLRHMRKNALLESDLVLLAGVPCDFRLDYGRHIRSSSICISVNRSKKDLFLNKKPRIAILADPGSFLIDLAAHLPTPLFRKGTGGNVWDEWFNALKKRDEGRESEIEAKAGMELKNINPVELFRKLDPVLDDKSILVADGGDFVATGSYTLNPRRPLSWIDPGVFGTLGVGAGFALGAKLCFPESEVWIIYGDGSCAYSIAEFDTFVRHNIPVIALVGNDACWAQIARDQIEILKSDVGCMLKHSDYDVVAKGYGGNGVRVENISDFQEAVKQAREVTKTGTPFLINAIIGITDFRKGSISM